MSVAPGLSWIKPGKITIIFTCFEIQTITGRHDRGRPIQIIHDMCNRSVALELPRNVSSTRGTVININCKTTAFITTFENFLLLHE